MTEEKMIPLSVIDALIAQLEDEIKHPTRNNYGYGENSFKIEVLEDLKKEAIPSPLEQKIKDILKEHKTCCSNKLMYKELRILVE